MSILAAFDGRLAAALQMRRTVQGQPWATFSVGEWLQSCRTTLGGSASTARAGLPTRVGRKAASGRQPFA